MQARKTSSTNYINQSFLENKCPLNELLFLLSKRWITETLFCIEEGNNRFSAIRNALEHISDHILADRLKLLEAAGFVNREVMEESPLKIEYTLTQRGTELSALLDNMCNFASAE
jgi:DNA-binding HxlR family transcriptional regulator